MRLARKLFLLAIMAITAMALSASTASATVELRTEPAGEHITNPKWPVHAEGNEVVLSGHVFGIEAVASTCHVELEGHVNEDGEGFVESKVFGTAPGHTPSECTRVPCANDTPNNNWPVHIREKTPGQLSLHAEFCVTLPDGTGETDCLVEAPIYQGPGGHHDYEIDLNDTGGVAHQGARCELTGDLHLEYDATHLPFRIHHVARP